MKEVLSIQTSLDVEGGGAVSFHVTEGQSILCCRGRDCTVRAHSRTARVKDGTRPYSSGKLVTHALDDFIDRDVVPFILKGSVSLKDPDGERSGHAMILFFEKKGGDR